MIHWQASTKFRNFVVAYSTPQPRQGRGPGSPAPRDLEVDCADADEELYPPTLEAASSIKDEANPCGDEPPKQSKGPKNSCIDPSHVERRPINMFSSMMGELHLAAVVWWAMSPASSPETNLSASRSIKGTRV